MTWPATCSNGWVIGTARATSDLLRRIRLGQLQAMDEWFGAVPGAMYRGTSARRTAPGSSLPTGTTMLDFVVLGKCSLDPFFFFLYRRVAPGTKFLNCVGGGCGTEGFTIHRQSESQVKRSLDEIQVVLVSKCQGMFEPDCPKVRSRVRRDAGNATARPDKFGKRKSRE